MISIANRPVRRRRGSLGCIGQVQRNEDTGQSKRLEKRYAGTVIGEMSFFLRTPRHDSIIADMDGSEWTAAVSWPDF